ncbi:uncharacterized protein OCT59_020096 [Rhizophagus irregularis]|uniref:uncharacterized protein n=1 Tax=Rhizophagus irregularis TaxID=588596 RepID=UPI0033292D38|nr:hypothetical protein OCT59_020096 [Rhizophagus irregularis]
MSNNSNNKKNNKKNNKQKQQRFQEETPDEGSNRQRGRTEEESNPNETSDKTNKSTSKSSPTKSNKQKQQRFQEETPDEGSNRQRGRTEEESNPNETSDKTNKSTSKSSPTKSNKQKQQRFQEETPSEGSNRQRERAEEESDPNKTKETPDEGSNRQRGRTEEESNPNETIDKTNKSTSKSSPIKSILKSAKSTKPTQEESDDEVIEIEPPNIPKVVKDDQGNERMIDDDDTDLEAENLKLKKQIEEVQVENAKLQRKNNRLFDENRFLTRINEAFADENDDLRESLNRYSRIRLPKAIHRQTDLEQPAKRQKRIKTKKSERYEEESEEERSGSNNNDEYDEKEARAEMKSILKTIDETRGLDYNKTFNSAKNLKICRKLVPELRSALAPCFPASNKQLTKWLGCLHKSRRSHQRLMDRGKADENKHRVHSNNRVHDKKIRRIKAAKRLYSFDDERITKYDKRRLLKMLSNRLFHSPEISETDEEDPTKSIIAIYDYSWRSDELKNLLRNVLDVHSSNKSKLIRERRYNDEVQKYDRPHPSNAPEWSYIVQQQDLIFDTDIDQGLITEYDEEEEEVSRGTTPATGNTTENDEDHNKEAEEKPSKSTVGDNHNNSDSDLHMDDAQ